MIFAYLGDKLKLQWSHLWVYVSCKQIKMDKTYGSFFFQTKDPFIIITTTTVERRRIFQITVKNEKVSSKIVKNSLFHNAQSVVKYRRPVSLFVLDKNPSNSLCYDFASTKSSSRAVYFVADQSEVLLVLFAGICSQNLYNTFHSRAKAKLEISRVIDLLFLRRRGSPIVESSS